MMMHSLALLSLVVCQSPVPDVQPLFHEHCASCHGETGAGDGWAELDRQARSFKEGGFSFGNTSDAIARTLRYGIPGTPMPAFDTALSDAQRAALADYVIALGPEVILEPTNTELIVKERPIIVRGALPPIVDGADPRPRGLLIGTTAGLSFEYRVDDVRLLGVRSGAFCDRSDWLGRGGSPLKPLGKLVVANDGGDPGATFWMGKVGEGTALVARFAETSIQGGRPALAYWLVHPERGRIAYVQEDVGARSTEVGLATERQFRVECLGESFMLGFSAARGDCIDRSASEVESGADLWSSSQRFTTSARFPQADGRLRYVSVQTPAADGRRMNSVWGDEAGGRFALDLLISLEPGSPSPMILTELLATEWSSAHDRAVSELNR